MTDDTPIDAHDVKNRYKETLRVKPGVETVGVDDANNRIIVGLSVDPDATDVNYPDTIEGVDVVYERFGEIGPETPVGAHPAISADTGIGDRTQTFSPIPGGVSIGHHQVSAGSSGFILTDGTNRYLASNNHVLANVNDGSHGDPVYQPGAIHDGSKVGHLDDYVPVQDGVTVDLAWAKIGEQTGITNDILGVGGPYGDVHEPKTGETLVSSGITSGVSSAPVKSVNTTVNVRFGENNTITLEDQIITGDMSGPGDSGSPVLHEGHPAGMIFAGSDSVTVISPASNIEEASGMEIETKDPPTFAMEDALWTFRAKPDDHSRYKQGVLDGDTYDLVIDQAFRDRTAQRVRSRRLDTAEIWNNSGPDELERAQAQRDFVREWMREAIESYDGEWPLLIRTYQDEGKYGRWLADLYNRDEESLFGALVEEFGEDVAYNETHLEELEERFDELADDL